MKLLKKHTIQGEIIVKTGIHIGGMKETFQIGGSDSPVIKTKNGIPYIPGSSLKGKLRALLEKDAGKDKICDCGRYDCDICILFGCHLPKNSKRSGVLIFRDGYTKVDDPKKLLETKAENVIDRTKGTAEHPRFMERVVPDTKFEIEIVYNEFKGDNTKELLGTLKSGFELLQKDYLGGSGTRGYGKVDVDSIIKNIDSIIAQIKL